VKLSFPIASILGDVAVARAESIGVPMAVAFSNQNAELIYFGKMEGALPASRDIAIQKAYTSAALRLTTQALGRLAQPGETLYGIQHVLPGHVVLFGGGLPLSDGNGVIGGVGISGGTVEEDIIVADTVREMLDKMVRLHDRLVPLLPDALKCTQSARRFSQRLMIALEQFGADFIPEWKDVLVGAVLLAGER
jgi:uncharacterized protein GlcG (DUF336 family)